MATQRKAKQDADYIFHELTRSICPECKRVINAQIIIRANKGYMRKRCPEHAWFEGLISYSPVVDSASSTRRTPPTRY